MLPYGDLCHRYCSAADPIHTTRLTGSILAAGPFGIIVVSGKSYRRGSLSLSNPPKLRIAGADGLFLVGLATHGFTKAGEDYLFARDTLLAYPQETGIRVGLLFEALAEARTPASK